MIFFTKYAIDLVYHEKHLFDFSRYNFGIEEDITLT